MEDSGPAEPGRTGLRDARLRLVMQALDHILVPDTAYPLAAVLGLLVLWQFHQRLVLKGRIYAVDFWDFSGVRMFMHAATVDGRACPSCRQANGTVFLPSLMTKQGFSTLRRPCSNPDGCRCLIVGLYGGWPEAERLVQLLRRQYRKTPLKLTERDLLELLDGPWHRSESAAGDRLTIQLLQAQRLEGTDPQWAIGRYRSIVEEAKGARDLHLIVPAFLRLADVTERVQGPEAALEVIRQFEKRFARRRSVFYYPSAEQRSLMGARKIRLQSEHRGTGQFRVAKSGALAPG